MIQRDGTDCISHGEGNERHAGFVVPIERYEAPLGEDGAIFVTMQLVGCPVHLHRI